MPRLLVNAMIAMVHDRAKEDYIAESSSYCNHSPDELRGWVLLIRDSDSLSKQDAWCTHVNHKGLL